MAKTIDLGKVRGERGEPFRYEDFTEEQLAALTGPQGPAGADAPLQIIDNPEFVIASRGNNVVHGERVHLADRWAAHHETISYQPEEKRVTFADTGSSPRSVEQKLSPDRVKAGDTVTVAIKTRDVTGKVYLSDANAQSGHADVEIKSNSLIVHSFVAGERASVVFWGRGVAALDFDYICGYVGAFTAETLPPYVPREYAVEMAECALYVQEFGSDTAVAHRPVSQSSLRMPLSAQKMRTIPSAYGNIQVITTEGYMSVDVAEECSLIDTVGGYALKIPVKSGYTFDSGMSYSVTGTLVLDASL